MYIENEKLKSFLLDSNLISKDEIAEAEKELEKNPTYTNIGDFFIANGKINEDDLRRVQAYIIGIPYIDIGTEKVPYEVLSIIPEPIARNHNIIAYKQDEKSLEVAMIDTDDLSAIDFIKKKTGLKILPRLTSTASMKKALLSYQKSLKADLGDIIKTQMGDLKVLEQSNSIESETDLKKIAEDVPVIRIVDTLLKHAILQNASDIHIEPLENQVVVRYRIDGILHDAMTLPRRSALSITARIKVLASLKLDEKRLPQDGRFKIELDEEKVSFRVSILPVYYGEKTVMRILREGGGNFNLESLGFHGEGLETLHYGLKQKTGLILTTGPTGSGKSTTLYTLLDILNTPDVNISTIEDPVEYQMKRVNQTQVKPEIGFSFAEGLRTLVRQDPDIIMVGEIRDKETASLGINAALTGHLVLSSLHTNSAPGAIPRLLDMGAESFLLVSTLKVVIAQRLVRKLDSKKEKYFLTKSGIESLKKIVNLDTVLSVLISEKIVDPKATWEKIPFYRPRATTDSDGYSGRIGIYEVLKVTDTIRNMIIDQKTTEDIYIQAKKEGMLSMIEDGIYKSVLGITTIEEVLRVVSE
jgi:type IV pilus assembly protein PilB